MIKCKLGIRFFGTSVSDLGAVVQIYYGGVELS